MGRFIAIISWFTGRVFAPVSSATCSLTVPAGAILVGAYPHVEVHPQPIGDRAECGLEGVGCGRIMLQPEEYGFFSNVNPDVDHPRWSQKTERRISGTASKLFAERIPTRMFNGYAAQVAGLYRGLDLRKWY